MAAKRHATVKSDLGRIAAIRDEDIDYSDIPDTGDDDAFFAQAPVEWPPKPAKALLSLRVDDDVVCWFRKQGRGYQTRMNQVLRTYMQHQQRAGSAPLARAASRVSTRRAATGKTRRRS